jgi:hypothetical protein
MKRNREAGQALAAAALAMVALIGIIGLAIDMGYMRYQKRRLQSAADSAAIAGASELQYYSVGDSRITTAAQTDSASNGFQDGVNNVLVTPHSPPTDPPFASLPDKNNYVEVTVQQNAPTYFMRIFGVNTVSVSATAVAHLGSSQNCLYALGASPNAVTLNGARVLGSQCGFISNGDFTATGGATVQALSIGVVGTSTVSGATVAPNPKASLPAADPLKNLPLPPVAACVPFVESVPPVPGSTYCGISISTRLVVFPSGLYVVTGDFNLSGAGSIQGIGVTFFITPDPRGISGNGAVNFLPSGGTDLQAPRNSGPYEGILMFRDPRDSNPPAAQFLVGTAQELDGTLYFPTAAVTLGPNTNVYGILVARDITLVGSGPPTINLGPSGTTKYSDYLPDGSPIKGAALVE